MAGKEPAARQWVPRQGQSWKNTLGRFLSFPTYPIIFPLVVLQAPTTLASAKAYRAIFSTCFVGFGVLGHGLLWRKYASRPWCKPHLIGQYLMLFSVDLALGYMATLGGWIVKALQIDRKESRILSGRLHGPRVLVVGNGPSAVEGKPLGHEIDKFDEVVRFNNFMCKIDGMEKYVGTKTTVHYSDGCLYPTFREYFAQGADVILSLFADRLFVSFSYLIQRAGGDLEIDLTHKFIMDPSTVWTPIDQIRRLMKDLGTPVGKHPTSGMLAIDWLVNHPGVQFPVYITGFDFFQGPKIHYYHDHEPWYERFNNNIGVNMHAPHLEKKYVEKLIAQGKVKFLRDEF